MRSPKKAYLKPSNPGPCRAGPTYPCGHGSSYLFDMYNAEGFALQNVYDAPKKHRARCLFGLLHLNGKFFGLRGKSSLYHHLGGMRRLAVQRWRRAAARRNASAGEVRPHGEVASVRVIFHPAAKVRVLTLEPPLHTHRDAPSAPPRNSSYPLSCTSTRHTPTNPAPRPH